MAAGVSLPSSTNVGGLPDLIKHDVNGLLVPPADPKALANAISRISQSTELVEIFSENAKKVIERYDWQILLKDFSEVIEDLIRNTYDSQLRIS